MLNVMGLILGFIGYIGLPDHWLGAVGLFAAGVNLGLLVGTLE